MSSNFITNYLKSLEIQDLHKIIQTCSQIIDRKNEQKEADVYKKRLDIINNYMIPILEKETGIELDMLTFYQLKENEIFEHYRKISFTLKEPFEIPLEDDFEEKTGFDPYHCIVMVYAPYSREKVYIEEQFKNYSGIIKHYNPSVSSLASLNQLYKELIQELYKDG